MFTMYCGTSEQPDNSWTHNFLFSLLLIPETLMSFQDAPDALPCKLAPVRFQMKGETDVWSVSVARVANVAMAVLSRFLTA